VPAAYGDLARLRTSMMALGARRLLAKRLAENDNSKNQIYLGSGFEALNVLPFGKLREESSAKNQILKAPLNFRWLLPDGSHSAAPHAQLILYPQYPEVRMSGFLKGSKNAPSDLMTVREAGRVMFLGISDAGIITAVVVGPRDALAAEFEASIAGQTERLFYELTVGVAAEGTRSRLLAELRRIHDLGWINSKKLLPDGGIGPCEASHCGGYTLEAELGIKPNGISEPDYLGWEIKQHNVSNFERLSGGPVTLMTPEPTGGFYKEYGVEAFLRKYGYADRLGRPDRINFGGTFRVGTPEVKTGLTMLLDGYNAQTGKLTDSSKGITLIDRHGAPAAVWGYSGLIRHWARKHERAAYVPSLKRSEPRRQYRYGRSVLLGQGTDFFRFLNAMSLGYVYYDPGIKLENASSQRPRTKRRSQFRIPVRQLECLYEKADRTEL
jgi:hypothetical protein